MKVNVPARITEQIAIDANRFAREWTVSKGWKGTRYLDPNFGDGFAGIRTRRKYLIYQDKGIRPFLMTALEGKTIKMGRRFRRVAGVGKPGFVNIPAIRANQWGYAEDIDQKVWRDQKWKHPGLKPKRFLEDSIEKAINVNKPMLARYAAGVIDQSIKETAKRMNSVQR